jgi:hypothetical protein
MKYYKKGSNPLQRISEEQIKAGDIVYNELGKCVKKLYVGENIYFVEVLESVLNEGEVVSELTPIQLELFWKLSNNKLSKHENKNQSSRGNILY